MVAQAGTLSYTFMCIGNEDGSIGSKHPNPAVPLSLLTEILEWREGGISMDDIVDRLRPRTVPSGYPYCTWKAG